MGKVKVRVAGSGQSDVKLSRVSIQGLANGYHAACLGEVLVTSSDIQHLDLRPIHRLDYGPEEVVGYMRFESLNSLENL